MVVLFSGRALDVGYLEPLALALAQSGHRAVRISRGGAGNSIGSLANVTYHTHAAAAAAVIRALHVQRATVLGHAVGNRIARTVDSDYPSWLSASFFSARAGRCR